MYNLRANASYRCMLRLKTIGHKINLAPFNFFIWFEPSIYHNFPPILFISLRKLQVQVVTRRAVTGSTHPSGHLTARIIMGRRATNCNHTLSCSQPWRGATKSKPRPWHHHYYHDSDQHTYTLYRTIPYRLQDWKQETMASKKQTKGKVMSTKSKPSF